MSTLRPASGEAPPAGLDRRSITPLEARAAPKAAGVGSRTIDRARQEASAPSGSSDPNGADQAPAVLKLRRLKLNRTQLLASYSAHLLRLCGGLRSGQRQQGPQDTRRPKGVRGAHPSGSKNSERLATDARPPILGGAIRGILALVCPR